MFVSDVTLSLSKIKCLLPLGTEYSILFYFANCLRSSKLLPPTPSPLPPLTPHVKPNDWLSFRLAVGGDSVANHAPCWPGQHSPGAAELVHGGESAIGLHEQHPHVLWGTERVRKTRRHKH